LPYFNIDPLLEAMLDVAPAVSDLNLSVGRPPQVEVDGQLRGVSFASVQRLMPYHTELGGLRTGICDILRANSRTREYIQQGEREGKSLLDAMEDGALDGMQTFDSELLRLVGARFLDAEEALTYATSPTNLRLRLASHADGTKDGAAETPGDAAAVGTGSDMDTLIER